MVFSPPPPLGCAGLALLLCLVTYNAHAEEGAGPPEEDAQLQLSPVPGESENQLDSTTIEEPALLERTRFEELERLPIHQFSNAGLAEYLQLRQTVRGSRVEPRDEVGITARRSLGQAYRLNATQFNLAEGDCVSVVNRALAISLATDYPSYAFLVERIRHKDGLIDYRNRNFFTLGDWLPNNAWILDDVTAELGPPEGKPAQAFTHVVRPKIFEEKLAAPGSKYTRITFKGSDYSSPDKEIRTESYIPTGQMPLVLPHLRTGDVVLVLRAAGGGHFGCDHLGLILVEPSGPNIVHSAPPHALQEDLLAFLERCHWIAGLKFLRLKQNAGDLARQEVMRMSETMPLPSAEAHDAYVQRLRARAEAAAAAEAAIKAAVN